MMLWMRAKSSESGFEPEFETEFVNFLSRNEASDKALEERVAKIVTQVRHEGDAALVALTRQLDRAEISEENLAFSEEEMDAACQKVSVEERSALEQAAERILAFHQRQQEGNRTWRFHDAEGTLLGQRVTPIRNVGIYVPGGLASYPSSVLMNALPARVAGVQEIIMTVPTPNGEISPLTLLAARLVGISRIFRIGGAQAIAALVFGTKRIPAVDKIVGPGNQYVATAKRQLFGRVGIDMIAGPSEILVIADADNDPSWIAADLLSQAEHDVEARAILIVDNESFGRAVEEAIESHLVRLSRREICRRALQRHGAVILVENLKRDGCALASRIAPEHLELAVENPEDFLPGIQHAGAIFMGRYTPEAVGDYVAGPNHVLPTGGTARFSSPLGVYDFVQRTSLIGCSSRTLRTIGPNAVTLANSEGLTAHQLSVSLRLEQGGR